MDHNLRRYRLHLLRTIIIALLLLTGWRIFIDTGGFANPSSLTQLELMEKSSKQESDAPAASASTDVVGSCSQPAAANYLPLLANTTEPDGPSFAVSAPPCRMLVRGFSGSFQVRVLSLGGFAGNVALALDDLPTGISGAFTTGTIQVGQGVTLTLDIANSASVGTHLLTIRGTAGSQVKESELAILVVEPLIINGRVEFDDGGGLSGAQVSARSEDGQITAVSVNTNDGAYTVVLPVLEMPAKVLVQASLRDSELPLITNQKWQSFATRGAVQMERILLPNPEGAEFALANSAGTSADATLQVDGLPAEVNRLFGRAYDPDADAELFPGDFTEGGEIPLNSSGFVWIVALDAQGNQVTDLSQATTIRSRIPPAQWPDLEDIEWGTDRIETPIYTFNESNGMWEQMGIGWLEDGAVNILPEEEQARIIAGTFPGEIYATFHTTHFSFMNVDYASYGPWTLSRMDRDKRNNDCFFDALKLAKAIALSPAGRNAYANVNLPNADLGEELADGKGPEIKTGSLEWGDDSQTNGEYNGDNVTGDNPEDEVVLNNKIWDYCDDNKPQQKKDITLLLASTLLHETAHWKDDVKKNAGAGDRTAPDGPKDTAGEEGKQLEKDLFGGDLHFDPADEELKLDGDPIDRSVKDNWLDAENWEDGSALQVRSATLPEQEVTPLDINISIAGPTFNTNDSIVVQVTYQNVADVPIRVLDRMILEDYPLRFDIVHVPTGKRVGFLGGEVDTGFADAAFVTLAPDQSIQRSVDINRDAEGNLDRYNLRLGGQYQIKAIYTPFLGLPTTESNVVNFTLNPGGSVSGIVTAQDTGLPAAGTTILALLNGQIQGAATSNANGEYSLPALPPGTYTLSTRSIGYPRLNQAGVVVVGGQNTVANLVLLPPPHLSYGQTITGTIEEPNGVYSYTFSGKANENVLFRLAEIDPAFVPEVSVYRPNGTLLCETSSNSIAQELCRLDANGKYTIAANSFGAEIGQYGLFLQRISEPLNATEIGYGEQISGTVEVVAAMKAYTFTGSSGERVLVRLAEVDPSVVPDVRIYRPDSTLLCETSSNSMAQELCTLDADGIYTILAGSFTSEVGAFGLFIQSTSNPATPVAIAYGESKSGSVNNVSEMVAFTFSGSNGEKVVVRLFEDDIAVVPDVRIYRPDGTLLCEASSNSFADELCTLDVDGIYTILAGSFTSEVGAFGLFIESTTNPSDPVAIAYGENKNGSVANIGEMDAFTFVGNNGDQITVQLAEVDAEVAPDVRVYRPDGTLLCSSSSNSTATVDCDLDVNGSHTILAGSFGSELGAYTLSLAEQ